MQNMENNRRNIYLTAQVAVGQRGFTLIELVIVVALIGVIAAIATPQFFQLLPGMRVNTATRQVMSKMLLLKMKAISENKSYGITFTPGGSQYQVMAGGTVLETVSLPSGIEFGTNATYNSGGTSIGSCASGGICLGGSNTVSFVNTGTATTGTIYLIPKDDKASGGKARMKAISINSTGRIKALRYTGSSPVYWANF